LASKSLWKETIIQHPAFDDPCFDNAVYHQP